jgi:hypothetical protein
MRMEITFMRPRVKRYLLLLVAVVFVSRPERPGEAPGRLYKYRQVNAGIKRNTGGPATAPAEPPLAALYLLNLDQRI